ncbi:hypothetical protein [Gellertiella hungarica]
MDIGHRLLTFGIRFLTTVASGRMHINREIACGLEDAPPAGTLALRHHQKEDLMSEITKEEAIRRTVVAQMIVAECQAAEALRDQQPRGASTVNDDNLFEGVDYTPERGWSIPQGDDGNELQPTTVTTLPEGCDLPNGSPVTEIVTPPGYEITSHEAEITGLIWKVLPDEGDAAGSKNAGVTGLSGDTGPKGMPGKYALSLIRKYPDGTFERIS